MSAATLLSRICPPRATETAELYELRLAVREYLRRCVRDGVFTPGADVWLTGWDPEFSRDLAKRGYIGMTIPTDYGGHGRTHLERFVVTEELLAAGAPVAAHWIADRQIAPSLLTFGTEHQKRTFLPKIAAAQTFFAIGMSEPDSGSDLASVRTKATPVEGGWRVSGTKVWTSGAHLADAFFALARTAPLDTSDRHAGLSQFIVDLRSPDVQIRPIRSMTGRHHFNEVFLDDVFVPDDMVLGTIGEGWQQVNSELGFERSGPERFMSTYALFAEMVDETSQDPTLFSRRDLGRLAARFNALHHLSFSVANALEHGEEADTAAAIVKVLGTSHEGAVAELADLDAGDHRTSTGRFETLLTESLTQRPGFTLRGGASEILRLVIARGIGAR
ncbi:acyl-CoA dehydrogenase family protein [Aeromicrobium sp. CF4.19]|uniref:acyl-CoA dehydrogenase family protein n=1 Tax=Aeromicrobium sp. CF4.19 TaxID=3373082 RepID=UPI003EE7E3DC